MMPYWPVPPPMAGPATGVNMGMDYWGTPTSVPMHNKVIAAPASAPSSNSHDVVLSDPAIQVYCCAGFVSCFCCVTGTNLAISLGLYFIFNAG